MNYMKRGLFLLFLVLLFLPENAYGWGSGIHIAIGNHVLENLNLILPTLAEILRSFPKDYLYGCISADIFIGKGYKRRDDHCHNWSMGKRMLDMALYPSDISFSYGYLSHLAADIVAHNYYIPNQLYLTSSTKRFGHIYWEVNSDQFIEKEFWQLAMEVVSSLNHRNDEFLQRVTEKRAFNTKKKVYSRLVKIWHIKRWQRLIGMISRNSRWSVDRDSVLCLMHLSTDMVLDFLKHPQKAVCLMFDPVGTENISHAKKWRKEAKRMNGEKPKKKIFQIPEVILQISKDDSLIR